MSLGRGSQAGFRWLRSADLRKVPLSSNDARPIYWCKLNLPRTRLQDMKSRELGSGFGRIRGLNPKLEAQEFGFRG